MFHLHLKVHIQRLICWISFLCLHVLLDDEVMGGFHYLIGLVAVKVHCRVILRYLPVSHLLENSFIHVFFLHVANLLRFRA